MTEQAIDAKLELDAVRAAYQQRSAETQNEVGKALVEAAEAVAQRGRTADALAKALSAHTKELQNVRARFEDDVNRLRSERDVAVRQRGEARDRHVAELQHVVEELAGLQNDARTFDRRAEAVMSRVAAMLNELEGA